VSDAPDPLELLQGTLDVLVLKTLSWGPRHGYAIARWIRDTTDDALRVEEGALYPALHRLQKRGWVEAEWGLSENNRKAKYYRLTTRGRAQLKAEAGTWARYSAAVTKVLAAT
jgi:transcriptional regulator